ERALGRLALGMLKCYRDFPGLTMEFHEVCPNCPSGVAVSPPVGRSHLRLLDPPLVQWFLGRRGRLVLDRSPRLRSRLGADADLSGSVDRLYASKLVVHD